MRIAAKADAQVINVVPPAHVWENWLAVQMLDGILDEISRLKLSFVITRIDAAFPPAKRGADRFNYLYGEILTEPGRLPNGKDTVDYFRTTIGRKGYAEWMEEEIRYYAEHYARYSGLIGINLGPFSEPFSADAELSRLFREIPDSDSAQRTTWHKALVEAIHKADAAGHR